MAHIYLGRYEWQTSDGTPRWDAPGVASNPVLDRLDLRSLPDSARVAGSPRGFGIFVYDQPVVSPSLLFYLGQDLERRLDSVEEIVLTNTVNRGPVSGTVLDMLWDLLTTYADPTGTAFAKPLMPTFRRAYELHLGGFSCVRSKPFGGFEDTEGKQARAVLYREFHKLRIHEESLWKRFVFATTRRHKLPPGGFHYQKVLDAWCDKYQCEETDLIPKGEPPVGRLPKDTSVSDDFNRANAADLGASWTTLVGTWSVDSNEALMATTGATYKTSRYDTDLATDDHYAEATLVNVANGDTTGSGIIARKDETTTATFYWALYLQTTSETWRTLKRVTGTDTALGTNTTLAAVIGDIIRLTNDGSSITRARNGSDQNTATDTAITGNLRVGILGRRNVSGNTSPRIDPWAGADLTAAVPVLYVMAI